MHSPITVGTVADYAKPLAIPKAFSPAPLKSDFDPLSSGARTNRPFSESSKDLLLFFNAFRKVYHNFLRMSTPENKFFPLL